MTAASVSIGMSAEDVKAALRSHHPALDRASPKTIPGRWVTLEEWAGIDLLAIDCWSEARVVGYEVKVSRGDLRAELLDPAKRMEAVSRCTQFYLAVPRGLLTDEELAFEEPDWSLEDFQRPRCDGVARTTERAHGGLSWGGRCVNPRHDRRGRARSSRYGQPTDEYTGEVLPRGFLVKLPVPAVIKPVSGSYVDGRMVPSEYGLEQAWRTQGFRSVRCPTCGGKGCKELSRVEREAPTLWVPKDVGLIEVYPSGATTIRRLAPKSKTPKTILGEVVENEVLNRIARYRIADVVRWSSYRPDPRHAAR